MRLYELTGIKNINVKSTKKDINLFMHSKGFRKIGNGAFSQVYLGNNSVIKIFVNDSNYEQYINTIKNIPDEFKQFVPNISSIRSLPNNNKIKFVILEKLTAMPPRIHNIWGNFRIFHNDYINDIKRILNTEDINNIQDLMNILIDIPGVIYVMNTTVLEFLGLDFIRFLVWLNDHKPSDSVNDTHKNNIMMRNSTPVLIDPWAEKSWR